MAQTKRKRQTKHRGNAAGVVESRGRTGRKPTAAEKSGEPGDAAKERERRSTGATGRRHGEARSSARCSPPILMLLVVIVLLNKPNAGRSRCSRSCSAAVHRRSATTPTSGCSTAASARRRGKAGRWREGACDELARRALASRSARCRRTRYIVRADATRRARGASSTRATRPSGCSPRSQELGVADRGDPRSPTATSTTSARSRRWRAPPARRSTARRSSGRCSPTSMSWVPPGFGPFESYERRPYARRRRAPVARGDGVRRHLHARATAPAT